MKRVIALVSAAGLVAAAAGCSKGQDSAYCEVVTATHEDAAATPPTFKPIDSAIDGNVSDEPTSSSTTTTAPTSTLLSAYERNTLAWTKRAAAAPEAIKPQWDAIVVVLNSKDPTPAQTAAAKDGWSTIVAYTKEHCGVDDMKL